jgi:hypothetical protein
MLHRYKDRLSLGTISHYDIGNIYIFYIGYLTTKKLEKSNWEVRSDYLVSNLKIAMRTMGSLCNILKVFITISEIFHTFSCTVNT